MRLVFICFLFIMLIVTWGRYRRILHPSFLFTVFLGHLFLTDYTIRGSDHLIISRLTAEAVLKYALLVLLLCGALWAIVFFSGGARRPSRPLIDLKYRERIWLSAIAWVLLLSELAKRLYAAGSLKGAVLESIGPRGSQSWRSNLPNLGDHTFPYELLGMILPLAGLIFAYLSISTRRPTRWLHLLGWLIVLVILVANGSRTRVGLVLGSLLVFYTYRRGVSKRRALVGILMTAGVALGVFSLMYQYRSVGYTAAGKSRMPYIDLNVVYHQDDSFYRLLWILNIADNTKERWEASEFVWATLVQPIPRAVWPSKPALLSDYWGSYKEYWVTVTFAGELIAMAGIGGGMAMALVIGAFLFYMLSRAAAISTNALGLLLYLLIALYVYMIMRSLLNITQFMYLPLAGAALYGYIYYGHRGARSSIGGGNSVDAGRAAIGYSIAREL